MARIKIILPETFTFSTHIPVRITDINYGGHVGNDSILSLIHEVRVQYLKHYGFTETKIITTSLIMSDAAIEFKGELFYGDQLLAYAAATDFSGVGFDIIYKITKRADGREVPVIIAKTGMVCFNYTTKKMEALPPEVKEALSR